MFNSPHPAIRLKPTDWYYATWRNLPPLPRPEPQPFDKDAALEKLLKLRGKWNLTWKQVIPLSMTRAEAHFWLAALGEYSQHRWHTTPEIVAETLTKQTFDGQITAGAVKQFLTQPYYWHDNDKFIIVFFDLLPLPDFIDMLLHGRILPNFISGFRYYVNPFLTHEQRMIIRDLVWEEAENLTAIPVSRYGQTTAPTVLYIAASVGSFGDTIERLIERLPETKISATDLHRYAESAWSELPFIVFGLDDPVAVERHIRRLNYPLVRPEHIAGWLAHTELNALDWVYESITTSIRDNADGLFKTFALADDTVIAPYVVKLQSVPVVAASATAWLNDRPEVAARGALQVWAAGGDHAGSALTTLRVLNRRGELSFDLPTLTGRLDLADRFRAEVLDYEDNTPPAFTEADTPQWLADAMRQAMPKKLPPVKWLVKEALPPLVCDGHSLNEQQVNVLLYVLSKAAPDENAPPLLTALKAHVDGTVLDRWAWALYEQWTERGAPTNGKWGLVTVGWLGNDVSAFKLVPLIRRWPGEGLHQRAVTGLTVLRLIGTETALLQLHGIAQKVQFAALKRAAQAAIDAIAHDRGLTPDQLADLIVPDCGLDEHGQRTFDYGDRQFTFVLSADLKPLIRDESGKLKPDLPKPSGKDDLDKAQNALAEWKLLKKTIREVAKTQAERLEGTLVTQRRWTPADFEMLLVKHPLMIHLVRRLIWGGYAADGSLVRTFRVTDEREYTDEHDDVLMLDDLTHIGLVYPAHLTETQLKAWGGILSDYEIIPPFPQLERRVFHLTLEEMDTLELTRFQGIKIEAVALVGMFKKLNWERGQIGDGGVYYQYLKAFPTANVTAVVDFPGVPAGFLSGWQEQTIDRAYFVPSNHAGDWHRQEHKLKLGQVDPVVISEVLRALGAIAGKGKAKP